MLIRKRFALTTFLAWLVFLMLDFLAHAVILNSYWAQEYSALKSKEELFSLIPFGYLSFLILTIMFGWLYTRLFKSKGNVKTGLAFGTIAGGLFALSNFFGWYSFLNLPVILLFLASLSYFVEISCVGLVYGYLLHPESIKRRAWIIACLVVFGFLVGIVLQNIAF
jgi:hypothetical protein